MIAKFRSHTEKLCIAKFRRDCEIFAILVKFLQCIAKNPVFPAFLLHPVPPPALQFLLTFLHPVLMKSPRIRKIHHQYEAKLEIMAEFPKTCKITKNKLETKSVVLSGPAHVNWLNSYD